MGRRIFRSGNSAVVSLPPEVLEMLGLGVGDEVSVMADPDQRRIVIAPTESSLPGVHPDFLDQVDRFIEHYRPALEKLAQE